MLGFLVESCWVNDRLEFVMGFVEALKDRRLELEVLETASRNEILACRRDLAARAWVAAAFSEQELVADSLRASGMFVI